jgi:penicillin-binding protein 1A
VWIDYMAAYLKGVPVSLPSAPPGVIQVGGEWFYDEYAHGAGVTSLGLEDPLAPPASTTEEERRSILDLFRP